MTPTPYNGEDRRVKRTQKLVLEALVELTVQKGFSGVTVSDITNRAAINRATFYRHYQDKFDLLAQYPHTVYGLLDIPARKRSQKSARNHTEELMPGLIAIYEHIRENAKFYKVMLGRNGDPQFTDQIRQYIQMRIQRSLPPGLLKSEGFLDFYLNYRSNATIGTVLWWLEHEMPYTPEEMAALTCQFEAAILHVLRNQNLAGTASDG